MENVVKGSLIETWDVLKSKKDFTEITRLECLIETWDVLKF